VREATRRDSLDAFSGLTEQELKVLALIAEGKTNREIAEALFLGEGTVRNYVSNVLGKLNVSNRAEAAAYAVKNNLKDIVGDTR
jgi:DNA-binding NarL/FixJ family response regulator